MGHPLRRTLISAAQQLGDRVFDLVWGTETARVASESELDFDRESGVPYQPSSWFNLISFVRVMRTVDVGPEDAFLDLGCGKGQMLIMAERYPFGRIIGLDLSARMVAVAEQNLSSRRSQKVSIEVVQGNAADYQIPGDVAVLYMYNPFPRSVMTEVMGRLTESLDAHPRRLHVLYLEARDGDLLLSHGFREIRRIRRLRQYLWEPADLAGAVALH